MISTLFLMAVLSLQYEKAESSDSANQSERKALLVLLAAATATTATTPPPGLLVSPRFYEATASRKMPSSVFA